MRFCAPTVGAVVLSIPEYSSLRSSQHWGFLPTCAPFTHKSAFSLFASAWLAVRNINLGVFRFFRLHSRFPSLESPPTAFFPISPSVSLSSLCATTRRCLTHAAMPTSALTATASAVDSYGPWHSASLPITAKRWDGGHAFFLVLTFFFFGFRQHDSCGGRANLQQTKIEKKTKKKRAGNLPLFFLILF